MSYILDALRRADAERERGSVPSLHAQSVQTMGSDEAPPRKGKPMVWVVAGLSLALIASIAWQFMGRDAPRDTPRDAADVNLAQGPSAGQGTPPSVQPQPALLAVPSSPKPPVRSELPPVPAAPPPAPAPAPAPATSPVPNTSTPATKPANPATAGTSATSRTAAATPAPAASANVRIPTQDELPEDIRRQLPKFAVGGSIYSSSPASRFLILNGQIFHENDKVMPELVLEEIKLKAAVLRFRNQRFSISY